MVNANAATYVSNGKLSYEEMARGIQKSINDINNGKYHHIILSCLN